MLINDDDASYADTEVSQRLATNLDLFPPACQTSRFAARVFWPFPVLLRSLHER